MHYFSRKNACNNSNNFLSLSNFSPADSQYLQNRCQILEHILCYSEISPMNDTIKNFKSISDFYLRQLAKDVEIYRLSSDERSQLLDFLDYLHSVTHEIENMLFLRH